MTKVFSAILTASLLFLPVVVSAYGQGRMMDSDEMMCGRGMGMMDGCGMRGGMMEMMDGREGDMADFEAFRMLNLTPDQKNKMNKIQLDLRKQHWALMGKNIDNKALLNDLYAADRPDAKKIGQVYAFIFDIRRQMIESRIEAMNRMKEVLTKEQLDRLKQLREQGDFMHHGMMMDR